MCYQWEITKMSRETQSNITKYATWTITVVTTSQLAESCPLYQNSSITTPVKTTWNWLCGYHYFVNTIVVQCYPESRSIVKIWNFSLYHTSTYKQYCTHQSNLIISNPMGQRKHLDISKDLKYICIPYRINTLVKEKVVGISNPLWYIDSTCIWDTICIND